MNVRKNNNKNRFFLFCIIQLVIFNFFWYIVPLRIMLIWIMAIVLGLLVSFPKNKKIKIYHSTTFFYFMIIYFTLSAIINKWDLNNIYYLLFLLVFLLMKVLLDNGENYETIFLNTSIKASSIHMVGSISFFLVPTLYLTLRFFFFQDTSFSLTTTTNPGIAKLTGQNAFFVSIMIGILLINFLRKFIKDKKDRSMYRDLLLLVLGIIVLLSTGKRGHLIFCILSVLVIGFSYLKYKKIKIGTTVKITLLLLVSSYFIFTSSYFETIKNKFLDLIYVGNLTNGRTEIWAYGINQFKESPLIGIGFGKINDNYGMDAHNIYIQLLVETGIIGLLFTLLFFGSVLLETIKEIKNNSRVSKDSVFVSLFVQLFFLLYGITGNPLFDVGFLCMYISFSSLAKSKNIWTGED